MTKRFHERLEGMRGQTGFTLIELLATILILSILVAIAGNYYYHQRKKAWVAQVHASLRHMANAENHFVYSLGAPTYTEDLDDLHVSGYRWSTDSVIPYVALATNQTFCIQVHSAHDPSIVWHFSSEVGRQQEGPATPADCGDPEVLGRYITGPPPTTYGRDGQPSGLNGSGTVASVPGSESGRNGTGSSGSSTGSDDDGDGTTETGASVGNPTSSTGTDPGTGGGATTATCGGSTSGGSSGASNHPSGKDRDVENGNSGNQGKSGSDPDDDENGGSDKPGAGGGANTGDQDGNNGSGNDTDFEDDNRGPNRDGSNTPGSGCD